MVTTPVIPVQGTPGVLDPRNPSLTPQTYLGVMNGAGAPGGTLDLQSPADFAAANPRVAATATATIAGTVANGDSLTITVTHPAFTGGSLAKTIAAATGDTVSNLAEKFMAAFNADPQAQGAGLFLTAVLGVITFNWPGPLGNFATLTRTIGSGAETITFSNGGAMSGGSGPVYAYDNFQYSWNGQVFDFRAGQPYFPDLPLLTALVNDPQPIV